MSALGVTKMPAGLNPFVEPFEWKRLAASVAGDFGITFDELLNGKRFRKCVHARAIVAHFLAERGWSAVQIGRRLNTDHSNILHHRQRLPIYLGYYPEVYYSHRRHTALRDMAQERLAA
jgi:hypothetical protein